MLVLKWETISEFCKALEQIQPQLVSPITNLVAELSECAKFEENRKKEVSTKLEFLKDWTCKLERLAEREMEDQYKDFLEKEGKYADSNT